MSFQTNVMVNGQWVTRTVNIEDALRQSAQKPKQRAKPPPPLNCGILTQTLVESPVVNFILPVRLRSNRANDVAFIGDYFVQICELRPHSGERDESLHEILRKPDFGSRIRNAKVLGPLLDVDQDHSMSGTQDAEIDGTLPPQMLILVLENGDVVFLYVVPGADGNLEFRWEREESQDRTRTGHPGFLMAIDPESRHLALACPEGLLIVYELESMERMREQHARGESLRPVLRRHKKVLDVDIVQKMEFLYPQYSKAHFTVTHTILLLIIVDRHSAKMITYDWTSGDNISIILHDNLTRPHRLPVEHRTPLLLIPITVVSAFLLISEDGVAACRGVLEGSPAFEAVEIQYDDQTDMHHGRSLPLWAAWTRPYRMHSYNEKNDTIYLGREDGVVVLIESDTFNILASSVTIGKFDCNIGTAFCGVPGRFSDILIMGGESGPGKLMAFPPRADVREVSKIPNWSPSVDLALVRARTHPIYRSEASVRHVQSDRMFAATGNGAHGAITEYRFGLQASIGADIEVDLSKKAWLFHIEGEAVYNILVSLVNRSDVLVADEGWENVKLAAPEDVFFDLNSETLDARKIGSSIVQVSMSSIVIIAHNQRAFHSIADTIASPGCSVVSTYIGLGVIALGTHVNGQYCVHILRLDDLALTVVKSFEVEESITAMSITTLFGIDCIVVSLWSAGLPSLVLFRINDDLEQISGVITTIPLVSIPMAYEPSQATLNPESSSPNSPFEQVTSMVVCGNEPSQAIVLGTRSGDVITIILGHENHEIWAEKFGVGASYVVPFKLQTSSSVFVCTDNNLYLLTELNFRTATFERKHQVFAIDVSNQSVPTVPILSVTTIESSGNAPDDIVDLVLLGSTAEGSKILLSQLLPQPRTLPRGIPVGGTPGVVIYSERLGCLVVGVLRNGTTSLVFLDPDSGNDISCPSDKDKNPQTRISGLGKEADKIHCIYEWLYESNGHLWQFFVVGTREGRLIVVSAEVDELEPSQRRIRYWTRWKSQVDNPIFSIIAGDAGLFFCAGKTIHWQRVDPDQKRLVEICTYEIDSPAPCLELDGNSLLALSAQHSLEVIQWRFENQRGVMELLHCDPITREAVHMISVGNKDMPEQKSQLIIVADRHGDIAGMTVPWGRLNAELHIVFEGELPASIRRFRLGHIRPYWQRLNRKIKYGALSNRRTGEDLVGLCIDGSVVHLTLLDIHTTRLFRLIQALAEESVTVCPFNQHENDDLQDEGPSSETFKKHINGDILRRVLKEKILGHLLRDPQAISRLQEYLVKVDGGKWTTGIDMKEKEQWIGIAYDMLKYFLQPVL